MGFLTMKRMVTKIHMSKLPNTHEPNYPIPMKKHGISCMTASFASCEQTWPSLPLLPMELLFSEEKQGIYISKHQREA